MRTRTKVVIMVLAVLVIVIGGLTVWQWNNLKALHSGITLNPASIQEELDAQQKEFDAAMDEYDVPKIEFTQEEINQLVNGEVSADQIADSMIQKDELSEEEPVLPEETIDQAIQKEIATMYVLRETYVGKLDVIIRAAINEYVASDGSKSKEDIVYGKFQQLTALEKECDQQVAAVTSRMRDLLKQAGKDTSLAEQVEDTYQTEKSMKKAYYIQQMQGD